MWSDRPAARSGQVYLIPAAGLPREADRETPPPLFGPAPAGNELVPWLSDRLGRIARVQNLLRVAERFQQEQRIYGAEVTVEVELLRFADQEDRQGQVVSWESGGIRFQPGETVGVRLRNLGREPVDVTLLFVDSDYGIQPFFPRRGTIDNRLHRTDPPLLLRGRIHERTLGLEHFVMIAVKAQPLEPFAHFSFLAQPSLERARSMAVERGGTPRTIDSPLGKLFQNSLFGGPTGTRGIRPVETENYALRAIHFQVTRPASPRAAD